MRTLRKATIRGKSAIWLASWVDSGEMVQGLAELTPGEYGQIHQYGIGKAERAATTPDLRHLFAAARQHFRENCKITTVSRLQKDIVNSLKIYTAPFGWALHEEYQIPDLEYSVDILLTKEEQRIIIEVDGPTHYRWQGKQYLPTGNTLFKLRHLKLTNIPVHAITSMEWDQLADVESDKQAYLRLRFASIFAA